ncbi:MAG: hypothetical protein FJ109_05905 [Deltaproteobacteria bacterium]|nr:hypothetical protein [Deltaproteobacteria bacterium]
MNLVLAVATALCLGTGGVWAQTPAEQFELARNAFHYQDYERVIALLTPLLEPEPTLPSKEQVLQAREWLGASYWWKGEKVQFRQQYTRLLQEDPDFQLDPFFYPPEMVQELEDLRNQLIELKVITLARKDPVEPSVVIVRTVKLNDPWVNVLPFGGGQFAQRRYGKGALFLSSQLLCLGANGGSWLYMYLANPTGSARTAALSTMYAGIGTFAAMYLWGVVDAFVGFEREQVIEEKEERTPGGEAGNRNGSLLRKEVDSGGDSASIRSVLPLAIPGGGFGLGLTLSF